jgi:hypothetical protein
LPTGFFLIKMEKDNIERSDGDLGEQYKGEVA